MNKTQAFAIIIAMTASPVYAQESEIEFTSVELEKVEQIATEGCNNLPEKLEELDALEQLAAAWDRRGFPELADETWRRAEVIMAGWRRACAE